MAKAKKSGPKSAPKSGPKSGQAKAKKSLSKVEKKSASAPAKSKSKAKLAVAKKAKSLKAAKGEKVAAKKTTAKKTTAKKTTAKKTTAKKTTANKVAVTPQPARLKVLKGGLADTARAKGSKAGSLFSPLDDRILVQIEGAATVTPGGIIIPDMVANSERPNQGHVLAVGPGHRDKKGRLRPLDVKAGDRVMFSSFAGSEVKIGNEEFLVLRESDVIAVVKA